MPDDEPEVTVSADFSFNPPPPDEVPAQDADKPVLSEECSTGYDPNAISPGVKRVDSIVDRVVTGGAVSAAAFILWYARTHGVLTVLLKFSLAIALALAACYLLGTVTLRAADALR